MHPLVDPLRRALRLALRGAGQTSPNPPVGCVIVRDGQLVGQGWHVFRDRLHAERVALAEAGPRARGADLYVTLEPCCHHGRTPPCVEAIIASGVRRVVCGVSDPNPQVAGRGLDHLRAHGIQVELAPDPAPYQALIRAFTTFITHGRPHVALKAAVTLDGRLAPRSGPARWITGPRARQTAHVLRHLCDAVLVGIGTVLADDPLLTARLRRADARQPLRAVLDARLRLPLDSRLAVSAADGPVRVYTSPAPPEGTQRSLRAQGLEVVVVPAGPTGLDLNAVLADLAGLGHTALLVEGGAAVLTAFVSQGLADEFWLFYAPKLLGAEAVPLCGPLGAPSLAECPRGVIQTVRPLPPDVLIQGRFHPPA